MNRGQWSRCGSRYHARVIGRVKGGLVTGTFQQVILRVVINRAAGMSARRIESDKGIAIRQVNQNARVTLVRNGKRLRTIRGHIRGTSNDCAYMSLGC